ncbi:Asp/Glu-specific dipeptidyl-peptidase [Dyadobacter sp. CECT 9275]|uniref:Dipeptidyl-peptidase n=1 Tax=Dyadobacter helix TaxID=2822344 RepID=A0A916J849_9BACT|nr:S46 family peptidase [Dyadobacter sp. CECT 9275]CAG4989309.1 Asp/Glu-specific dipeptidyl-peptidase [Dyadobacter sp. CECT 9275]
MHLYKEKLAGWSLVSMLTIGSMAVQAQDIKLDSVKAGEFDMGKMWTFDTPPVEYFQKTYNFTPDEKWFEKARLSALRFATYCSASFVSADGLVMTNHHCARESGVEVQKKGEDIMANGFYAEKLSDERKVPGLFVDQLVKIEDITERIQKIEEQGESNAERIKLREQAFENIKKEYGEKEGWKGLEIQTVSFYSGGRYSLYGFKRYNDVRLVFMPELQMGFFGGDADNFTYPRYNLDCSFFRVYDDAGKPLRTSNYYKFNPDGVKDGEAVFVVGNPGSTGRLRTVDELELDRDKVIPFTLQLLRNRSLALQEYNKTIKSDSIANEVFSFENGYKAYKGRLDGMNNPVLMARKKDFERSFKKAVRDNPKLTANYGLWDAIAENVGKLRAVRDDISIMQPNPLIRGELLTFAQQLADFASLARTDPERANTLKGTLKAFKPKSMELEEGYLAAHLSEALVTLGSGDAYVKTALAGKPPKEAASLLLRNSKITDEAFVTSLMDGGENAITASTDPLIALARISQPRFLLASAVARDVNAKLTVDRGKLGRLLYDVYGTNIPPDATFSLRISDGLVKSYNYNGTTAPVKTTYAGMYDRFYSYNKEFPWSLPQRWQNPSPELMKAPINFISTNDIIGGNSGSPMINKNLEAVGLIFDGNMESLPGYFIFAPDAGNRTVSVHAGGMLASMKYIYKAKRLVEELSK